jgi:GntR family transcriptional regulator / MocR family aminotransferase
MFLKLDQDGLLYSQVYRALRRQILSGRMRPGSRLPSTRWLASELGVSRNTALLAYEQLIAEGYLTAGSHAGTNVASELRSAAGARRARPGAAFGNVFKTMFPGFRLDYLVAPLNSSISSARSRPCSTPRAPRARR